MHIHKAKHAIANMCHLVKSPIHVESVFNQAIEWKMM